MTPLNIHTWLEFEVKYSNEIDLINNPKMLVGYKSFEELLTDRKKHKINNNMNKLIEDFIFNKKVALLLNK